jgi:hypothetical protein
LRITARKIVLKAIKEKSMAEEKRGKGQGSAEESGAAPASKEQQTGDPGRTPGTAEGDRETVEADLRDKEGSRK